jgi:hypothetical protein
MLAKRTEARSQSTTKHEAHEAHFLRRRANRWLRRFSSEKAEFLATFKMWVANSKGPDPSGRKPRSAARLTNGAGSGARDGFWRGGGAEAGTHAIHWHYSPGFRTHSRRRAAAPFQCDSRPKQARSCMPDVGTPPRFARDNRKPRRSRMRRSASVLRAQKCASCAPLCQLCACVAGAALNG